jgi:DNA-binding cell septation regulator SpoVG
MNIKMRLATGCGKTVAFFSVEWPGHMTVNECKLIDGKNGLFVGLPQKEYTQDGVKKYKAIVYVERDLQDKITTAAGEEYRRLTGEPAQESYDDIPF